MFYKRLIALSLLILCALGFFYKKEGGNQQSKQESPRSPFTIDPLRVELVRLIKGMKIKTLVDVPCGELSFADEISPFVQKYIGIDADGKITQENRERYGSSIMHFQQLDITKDPLPQGELIFCHDILNFLSPAEISSALLHFKKSGAQYLLMTLYTDLEKNQKGKPGVCRPIDWQIAPYHFPKPLLILTEHGNKKLALWKMEDLP